MARLICVLLFAAVLGMAQVATPQPKMPDVLDYEKLPSGLTAVYAPNLSESLRQLGESLVASLNKQFASVERLKGTKWLVMASTQDGRSVRLTSLNISRIRVATPLFTADADMVTWVSEAMTPGTDTVDAVVGRIIKKMVKADVPTSPSKPPAVKPTQLPVVRACIGPARDRGEDKSPHFPKSFLAKSDLGKVLGSRRKLPESMGQEFLSWGVVVYAMALPDYYKLLQLDRGASPEQVWLSYHKLKFLAEKRKLRMDQRKFFQLHHAYYILSDEFLRQEYDLAYSHRPVWGVPWSLRRAAVPFLTGFVAGALLYLALLLK